MAVKKDLMNIEKKQTIDSLYSAFKEKKKDIYKKVADDLSSSRRRNIKINLTKIESLKNVSDGSIVIVSGKILGVGTLNKKVTVYAYSFSKSAKEKLKTNAKNLLDFAKDKIDLKKAVIIK
jgi:large subunit ribosomal protein L18e